MCKGDKSGFAGLVLRGLLRVGDPIGAARSEDGRSGFVSGGGGGRPGCAGDGWYGQGGGVSVLEQEVRGVRGCSESAVVEEGRRSEGEFFDLRYVLAPNGVGFCWKG